MIQRIFIYRALIFNKRLNDYSIARTMRDKQFNNINEVMIDYNEWVLTLMKTIEQNKDSVIINEQLIGL